MNPEKAIVVVIDMQKLFDKGTWGVDSLHSIVPNIKKLTAFDSIVLKFIPAEKGSWKDHYKHFPEILNAEKASLGLLEELADIEKTAKAVYEKSSMGWNLDENFDEKILGEKNTFILVGVETDVCVLATLFYLIDKGYYVIIVKDAVTSSDLEAHKLCIDRLFPRFVGQVHLLDTTQVLNFLQTGEIDASI